MRELRLDMMADAVERHQRRRRTPIAAILPRVGALVGSLDPDADAILAAFAADVEGVERADDPFFQGGDIGAHVGPPRFRSSIT